MSQCGRIAISSTAIVDSVGGGINLRAWKLSGEGHEKVTNEQKLKRADGYGLRGRRNSIFS